MSLPLLPRPSACLGLAIVCKRRKCSPSQSHSQRGSLKKVFNSSRPWRNVVLGRIHRLVVAHVVVRSLVLRLSKSCPLGLSLKIDSHPNINTQMLFLSLKPLRPSPLLVPQPATLHQFALLLLSPLSHQRVLCVRLVEQLVCSQAYSDSHSIPPCPRVSGFIGRHVSTYADAVVRSQITDRFKPCPCARSPSQEEWTAPSLLLPRDPLCRL